MPKETVFMKLRTQYKIAVADQGDDALHSSSTQPLPKHR